MLYPGISYFPGYKLTPNLSTSISGFKPFTCLIQHSVFRCQQQEAVLIFSLHDNTWPVAVKEIATWTHFELRFPVVSQPLFCSTFLSCERSTCSQKNTVYTEGGRCFWTGIIRGLYGMQDNVEDDQAFVIGHDGCCILCAVDILSALGLGVWGHPCLPLVLRTLAPVIFTINA